MDDIKKVVKDFRDNPKLGDGNPNPSSNEPSDSNFRDNPKLGDGNFVHT